MFKMKIQNNKSEQKGIKRDRPQQEKGPTPIEKGTDPNRKRDRPQQEKGPTPTRKRTDPNRKRDQPQHEKESEVKWKKE